MTFDKLMERYCAGDDSAFDAIVRRFYKRVLAFFHRQTRDWQLSEDLAQDTFLCVSNSRQHYVAQGRFESWVFRIARNKLIDASRSSLRRISAVVFSELEEVDSPMEFLSEAVYRQRELDPCDSASCREIAEMCKVAVSGLPTDQRLTIEFFAEDESLSDIGYAMGVSLPTTKSRLRLAREKAAVAFARNSRKHAMEGAA